MNSNPRVKNVCEKIISDHWAINKKVTFDYLRSDGRWQHTVREIHDHGNGVVVLLYNRQRKSIILIRQFRYPVFAAGYDGMLIEAPAGLLDNANPQQRIKAEIFEETGYQIDNINKIYQAFMTPGSVTEELHFFIAEYQPEQKMSAGGGLADEGEDIEVIELPFAEAMTMLNSGQIRDAKTIILLQYAALNIFN